VALSILQIVTIVYATVDHGDAYPGAIHAEYAGSEIRAHSSPAVIGAAGIGIRSSADRAIRRDELDVRIVGEFFDLTGRD
jgi:hypothetical protein